MKLIKIGMVLCGMCFGFLIETAGQTIDINAETSGNDSLSYVVFGTNDSLVHVAYKTINKKDLSGAISVLNPSEYLDKHYGTYPLDGTTAFIGGSNLWNIGNTLVLVDGVPRSVSELTSNEIEQITFLKGVNATVLYGSRAANGVILITTKRGQTGERRSNVRANAGVNMPVSYPEYLGSAEYMRYFNQACLNDGLTPMYADSVINNYAAHSNPFRYPDVDYYSSDYLRKSFKFYTANAEFSQGTDRARFYAAAGIQNQNSLLNFGEGKNDNITRLNVRGNIDLKLNDFINTYVSVSTVFYDSRSANGDYWSKASTIQPHRFSPLVPISSIDADDEESQNLVNDSRHIIDGKYLLGGSQEYLKNPIADIYAAGYSTFTSRQFQYTGGVDADLKSILKGLSFHGQMGIDYSNTYVESVNNGYAVYVPEWISAGGSDSIAVITKFNKDSITGNKNLSGIWNDQVIDYNVHFDYVNTINNYHNFSAMIVAAGVQSRQTADFQYRTNANLGLQLAYNYDHRYYADFSGAIVNSTKLPVGKRGGFSPTLSVGWLLTEEGFLKSSGLFDRLKITASAGILNTDMDLTSYYLYDAEYSSTAWYSWADAGSKSTSQATTISRGQNLNLTYARRKEVNFGLEGSLFNRLLDFQATAFFIKKDGIPVQSYTQYPSFFRTGWPETSFVPYTNFESNSYQGFDLLINFHSTIGEVNLTLGAAATYITTKALKRDELYADSYRNRVGKPTGAIFGLESEGFFMDQKDIENHALQKFGEVKPGDIKYKDQNNDGIVDERDEVMIGNWNSPFTGGLHFTAQWKNLTFFALGTGRFGGTGIKDGIYYWVYGDRKYSEVVRNSWTEETKNTAIYPRLTTLSGDNNFRYSDFWIYKTDIFSLSKVQLTYSLPAKILDASFIKGLNFYVSGANLLTISKNKNIMELSIGGWPYTRFYNFGVKAEF